jgi:RNA polymerase sigma-70 factor, ECF subfamily
MNNKNLDQEWSALMKKAQDGDSAAYEFLLEEVSDFLKMYLKKRIFNKDHIEDLIQEVLLAIHKARHSYERDKPFFPWVHAIIKYKSIDYFKAQKKTEAVSVDDSLIQLESKGSFEQSLENRMELESLLSDLPEKYQQLLKTVKLDGYSVKEAAVLLGLSVANVKTSVHRVLKQLKEKRK